MPYDSLTAIDFVTANRFRCERVRASPPRMHVKCTLQQARTWGVRPATLAAVARHLGLRERPHHRALDDAETCAEIALAGGLAA